MTGSSPKQTTKVKICGITNSADALLSVKFGADALGFNFYERSPRFISPETARHIIEKLPQDVYKVGIFINESFENIRQISDTAKLDAIQLHGEESPQFLEDLRKITNLEIIKAFRVSKDFTPDIISVYHADAILLDAYNPNEYGGTGETFDWQIARRVCQNYSKMYLAGGLSADNVRQAIAEVKPFAVDVCSCLEARKGIKDAEKLKSFLNVAKQ